MSNDEQATFAAPSTRGAVLDERRFRGRVPVLLVVVGAITDPTTGAVVEALNLEHVSFGKRRVQLLVAAGSPEDEVASFASGRGQDLPILADPNGKIVDRLRIDAGAPRPFAVAIATDGSVLAVQPLAADASVGRAAVGMWDAVAVDHGEAVAPGPVDDRDGPWEPHGEVVSRSDPDAVPAVDDPNAGYDTTDPRVHTSVLLNDEEGAEYRIAQEPVGSQMIEGSGEFPREPRAPQWPAPGAARDAEDV